MERRSANPYRQGFAKSGGNLACPQEWLGGAMTSCPFPSMALRALIYWAGDRR